MGLFNRRTKPVQKPKALLAEELELAERLAAQDQLLSEIYRANDAYKNTGDIGTLIEFWEDIWPDVARLLRGSILFRLPDLYIKIEDYDNALRILGQIENPEYQEKVYSYIQRVTELKAKQRKKQEKARG